MNTCYNRVLLVATLCASFSCPVFGLSDVEYFDFVGWDHNLVSDGGQTFTDIFGDIDVTVTSIGDFDLPTGFGAGWINTGGHLDAGSHTLVFTFSEPLRLVVKSNTVDSSENLRVNGAASKSYFHSRGAFPSLSNVGQDYVIRGNGFGLDPASGASQGEVLFSDVLSSIRVSHASLTNSIAKYERVMVGTLVPEPNACGLLVIGFLGMCQRFRRRR